MVDEAEEEDETDKGVASRFFVAVDQCVSFSQSAVTSSSL